MGDVKIEALDWSAEKVVEMYSESCIVNLDKVKFIKDNKEYTADNLFDLIADKVIEKIKA